LDELDAFLKATIRTLRTRLASSTRNDISSSENLVDYLSGFMDYIGGAEGRIITDKLPKGAGRHKPGTVTELAPHGHRALFAQLVRDDQIMRFKLTKFHEYLDSLHVAHTSVVEAMVKQFNMTKIKTTLGAGTISADSVQSRCYELNLNQADLAKFIELPEEEK
jgi:hypothetical protein